ncbi:hypothetical protein ABTZ58_23535 [Streptomyces sp. NPDC094143]|uniref:hypothetical protein n=1 Tax=Streptomyces sp. NPDC094143 TaxID=3155310 RepID=UPI00332782B7
MTIVFDGTTSAFHGSVSLSGPAFDDGVWERDLMQLPDLSNGLVAAVPDAMWLSTGSAHSEVRLTLELLPTAPVRDDETWDMVVEVSVHLGGGTLENDDDPRMRLTPPAAGWYRLRASARGRSEAQEQDGATEVHRIVLWPAPPEAEQVIRHDGVRGGADRRPLPALGSDTHPVDLNGYYD